MDEYGREPLPPEFKYLKLNKADIAAGIQPDMTKDGLHAWELYRGGTMCVLGGLVLHTFNVDPIIFFFKQGEVRAKVKHYEGLEVPVYMGPYAAQAGEESPHITAYSSDVRSSSFGIWVPRDDADFDPDAINLVRLA